MYVTVIVARYLWVLTDEQRTKWNLPRAMLGCFLNCKCNAVILKKRWNLLNFIVILSCSYCINVLYSNCW